MQRFLMYIVFLIICIVIISTFIKSKNKSIEKFNTIEMVVSQKQDSSEYVPSKFQMECSRSLIKPNDCKFTNIIHYIKNKDTFNFIGTTPYETNYYVIAPNISNIDLVKDIPSNSVIYYKDEGSLSFFQQLINKIYKKNIKDFTFKPVTTDISNFIDNHCNSYDINNNIFIDYLSKPDSNSSFFVYGLNTHFDTNLMRYYDSYFSNGKRTKYLQIIDNDPYTPTLIKYAFFKSTIQYSINPNMISMDDIIYTDSELSNVNIQRLIDNEYIDFDKSQVYMDVYDCNIPDEIERKMTKHIVQDVFETDKYSIRKYKDSCADGYPTNERSLNSYKNFRCIDGGNYFTDILFPFISDYDIHLSELDFNKLIIYNNTFDGVIPIRTVNPENKAIDRYKINVNPDKYSIQAFIDDIYYSTDMYEHTDGKTYPVLTNSIPFELNDDKYEIIPVFKNNEVFNLIKDVNNDNISSTFTMSNGVQKTVSLQEGDRVFLKNEFIGNSKLNTYLANKLQLDNQNFYHGTVVKGTSILQDNKPYQKLVIKLFNIRKNHSLQGACFDSNWDSTPDKMISIKTKEECDSKNLTWDVPCTYNYECPFYKANKNYNNFRGGCLSNGFCEMPVGVRNRSFKKFENNNKDSYPMCYNCSYDVQDQYCCDEQNKLSEKNDSTFKSADYLFYNDSGERKNSMFQSSSECNKNSLKINKYI